MKRWLPLFSTILAVGFTAIGAHAQSVSEGLVAIYEGYIGAPSIDPYPTGLTQSTQQVSVDLVTHDSFYGTTVITNYLTPPCPDPSHSGQLTDHSCVNMGDTTVQWTCQRAPRPKLCTLRSNPEAALGVITQFWVNPSNPLKSIRTPPYTDAPDEGQPYTSYQAPTPTTFPSEAISLMTCPAGNNITCIMYNDTVDSPPICKACLLLAYGASGFVKHFRQWRQPLQTLSGSVGELIYVRQSLIKPIQTAADYNAALARIDTLMDADPDSAEGKELAVLTDMVKAFQNGATAK
jgi:hypothetical protein